MMAFSPRKSLVLVFFQCFENFLPSASASSSGGKLHMSSSPRNFLEPSDIIGCIQWKVRREKMLAVLTGHSFSILVAS